jgi:hypothetical protein
MSKPTHGNIGESLEVIWEVIHEWDDVQSVFNGSDDPELRVDNVKTAMIWIMDELGYEIDHGEIIAKDEGGEA